MATLNRSENILGIEMGGNTNKWMEMEMNHGNSLQGFIVPKLEKFMTFSVYNISSLILSFYSLLKSML